MSLSSSSLSTTITMPQLGETVTEGTITRWLKRVGEPIAKYEAFAEVATDKVNAEIPSPVAGVLLAVHVAEGETVPIGAVIAHIGQAGGSTDIASAPSPPVVPATAAIATPHATAPAPVATPSLAPAVLDTDTLRHYSPAVRRAVRATGVDPNTLAGSGVGGRVTLRDIENASGGTQRIPLTRARRMIAAHMVEAKQTIPHAWTMIEVDVSSLVAKRAHDAASFVQTHGFKPTYFQYFSYTVVQTLARHPMMNSRFTAEAIEVYRHIDLAFAVALDGNLVVPVVRRTQQMDFVTFARAMAGVTERARTQHLTIDELHGGTITVNNTGANGSILSSPIINGGQAAIITMESIVKRPVVVDHDAIAIRSMMNVCCSIDHRVIDGDVVGSFLRDLKKHLERIAD